jgi:hypothetical protein
MRVSDWVGCKDFPCSDVQFASYVVPAVEVDPDRVSIILLSEAAPGNLRSCLKRRRYTRAMHLEGALHVRTQLRTQVHP